MSFYNFVRFFLRIFFKLLYRHRVYGVENVYIGGALVTPNHASYYDPPLVAASWPLELAFLARESLFDHAGFRWIIKKLNAYPVSGKGGDITTLKLIGQLVQEGKQVVIFPEGSRTNDGSLQDVKSGIGMLAMKYHCALIPTYIDGAFEVWPRTRRFPKLWGRTTCVFGSPIFLDKFEALSKKEAQQAIAEEVKNKVSCLKVWLANGAQGIPP